MADPKIHYIYLSLNRILTVYNNQGRLVDIWQKVIARLDCTKVYRRLRHNRQDSAYHRSKPRAHNHNPHPFYTHIPLYSSHTEHSAQKYFSPEDYWAPYCPLNNNKKSGHNNTPPVPRPCQAHHQDLRASGPSNKAQIEPPQDAHA